MKVNIQERMLLNKIKNADEDIITNYALSNLYYSSLAYCDPDYIAASLLKINATSVSVYNVYSAQAFFAEFDTFSIVSFRGFSKMKEFKMLMRWWKKDFFDIQAHAGFVDNIQYILYQMLPDLQALPEKKRLIFTGHSMGGALAMLLAIAHRPTDICVFGCPKVASGEIFTNYYKSVNVLRFETKYDFATWMPPSFPFGYEHVGSVHSLGGMLRPIKTHKLENYLRYLL